jgi:hypothetical protein
MSLAIVIYYQFIWTSYIKKNFKSLEDHYVSKVASSSSVPQVSPHFLPEGEGRYII